MIKKPIIEYHYRGQVERGNGKPGYDWHNGYSVGWDGAGAFGYSVPRSGFGGWS